MLYPLALSALRTAGLDHLVSYNRDMAKKREGRGGNAARNPRNNLLAQKLYFDKFGKDTKKCSGLLHHDGQEVPITHFRQATTNTSTFLQSRCDTCNRLYFSIQQKPIKRLAAVLVFAHSSGKFDWKSSCPVSLKPRLRDALVQYDEGSCSLPECPYDEQHSDFRAFASTVTKNLSGIDKLPRTSTILDFETGHVYEAPLEVHDLQEWAGHMGRLWEEVSTKEVWKWWTEFYVHDMAYCSQELNEAKSNKDFDAILHPLSDFDWGSGNIKDTHLGHSVPAFNQVKRSASVLPSSSNLGGRAYGFLCDGDHLAMLRFSKECKKSGMSLGHSPAPLRWLGKNDPINGKPEDLGENVRKRDSLVDLHFVASRDPSEAAGYVSWQIRDLIIELGEKKTTLEDFTQQVEAFVESYFDSLSDDLLTGDENRLWEHLMRADPGKPDSVYQYRFEKISVWLTSRPGYKHPPQFKTM